MKKMGTIECRRETKDLFPLEQKYPIIAQTLAQSMPVKLISVSSHRFGDNVGEYDWLVQFSDNNRIPLSLINPEENEGDEYDQYADKSRRQQSREIRQLAGKYLQQRPELKARFEEMQMSICV